MIYLITGTPGSGKTLSAMELIEKWGREHPGRLIYSANIDGQSFPGVLPLDDSGVLEWHKQCAKDSLVVVDEAQRYWRASRGGDPSQAIIEMETHRHDGIDIVLMTQHPTFVHANIRKLVNVHIHLVAYTKQSALRYEWRECHDDVQENALRSQGEFSEWKYPAHLYQFYKSATMHTKRAKRSSSQVKARIWGVVSIVCFLILAAFVVVIWRKYQASKHAPGDVIAAADDGRPSDKGPLPAEPAKRSSGSPVRWENPGQYVQAQVPRIPSQPWSAPLYDGQQVTTHPQVYCIAKGDDSDCHCITEQGTRYTMPMDICLNVAKNGPAYDPFKPERRQDDHDREERAVKPSTTEASEPVVALAAVPSLLPRGVPAPARAASAGR
ncbi:zonular occludens toxin domain-containing protein [Luteibacter sp. 22Crub2.1]|uniref:zonular occludens toxin domain-containing protein n=1 Tax=Luteibacter sp. 22Crub2.1 TaxID=1283288 RepID=UPI0009A904BB|nr:zonular occludens toxin domain-containing protein [Luteibacter sp. 22Crub2.1]SKB73696.1 Zonula occludens toxin [Luteibacter sp. 22Crub2.1]